MNGNLISRLHNWKFKSALLYLDNEPDGVQVIVRGLAKDYGNIGWISGQAKIKDKIEKRLQGLVGYKAPSFMGFSI